MVAGLTVSPVFRGEEATRDNWPGVIAVSLKPTSSTMPTYSCPIEIGSPTGSVPRYGHRSDPQMQVAESPMTASVDFWINRLGQSSTARRRGRKPPRHA